jgi:hypothetical protein
MQGFAQGVRDSGYVREKERARVRKSGLPREEEPQKRKVPTEIFRKAKGANGFGKLRGQELLEYNLAVIARSR